MRCLSGFELYSRWVPLYKGEKGQILDVFVKTFHIIDPINPIICPQQAIERKSVTSRYHGSKISGSQ